MIFFIGLPDVGYKTVVSQAEHLFSVKKASIKEEVRVLLQGGTLLPCLTTDAWTSNQNDSYIAVTLHLIKPNWT